MVIVGFMWVVEFVFIFSIVNLDMECVWFMFLFMLVGGVCYLVFSLYSGCVVWWIEYSMFLLLDIGEVIFVILVGVVDCMLELLLDFGFLVLLDGEYWYLIL